MNRRVAVRGIALHEGKLLCVQLKKNDGPNNYWCLPGGKVEEGEPLIPALEREMIEELGVRPTVGNLLYVQQFVLDGFEHLEFFFGITNPADYLQIDVSGTTHGTLELSAIDFIDPAISNILPKFLRTEPLAEHAASSTPTKFFNNITLS